MTKKPLLQTPEIARSRQRMSRSDSPVRNTKVTNGEKKKAHLRTGIRRAKKQGPKVSAMDAQVEKAHELTYDQFKEFEGQRYTGMKIGGHHKWYYDQGIWRERKMTPDEWTFDFAVKKRRAGKAPKGSGVPVGTEYHWYILAHQNVKKLNANIYSTALSGIKFKAGYKKAKSEKWTPSDGSQKKRIVRFLKEMIEQLEKQTEK